jgi:drug/metabolite transporter (DMT)-like permease
MNQSIGRNQALLLVLCTVVLTTYAQLIVKWRVIGAGQLPADIGKKVLFYAGLLFDVWVISAVTAAFLAGLAWMAAMTRLELSFAYPFMSLSFVLVLICSGFLFHETVNPAKIVGMLLIIIGIVITSRG